MNRKEALAAGEKVFEVPKACNGCGGHRRYVRSRRCPCRHHERLNTPKRRATELLCGARNRAKKKGELFHLTKDRVLKAIKKGVCEKTGIAFEISVFKDGGHRNPYAPSIDKIIPTVPYSDQNVQIVIWQYNAAKSDFSDQSVIDLSCAVLRNNGYAVRKAA